MLAVAVFLPGVGVAVAADYPERAVRMVVPFSAGGPTDLIGRLVAQNLNEAWGRPVVVDNRGGAGGTIGVDIAIRAAADGHTLLFGSTSTFAVNPALYPKLPYNVDRDLSIIGFVAYAPQIMVVNAGLPANTVSELVALAKKQPGKLSFASSGVGTTIHLAGELLKHTAGIDIVHIPYKGGGQAVAGLLSGEANLLFNNPGALIPHIKSGKLRALAVAGPQRMASMPQLPTFAESGLPQVESGSAFGMAATAKTPAAILQHVAAALEKTVANPVYQERLRALGTEPHLMTTRQAGDYVKREFAKWKQVARMANVSLD